MKRRLLYRSLLVTLAGIGSLSLFTSPAHSQVLPQLSEPSGPSEDPLAVNPSQRQTTPLPPPNAAQPCIEPAPMVRLEDYQGPFRKVVGTFAGRLERKAVHVPHYKPGAKLCTLLLRDKFELFVRDSIDPVTFLGAGFSAWQDQAENADPSYGQGAQGYGRRFGAELAGQTTSTFFKDFAYPSIFSEDPRYYRMLHGPVRQRLLHAVGHAVLARRDDGSVMFNFSEWFGTASTVAVNNTYHPDDHRGFAPAAERVGFGVLQDTGFNVLREFWPEIARKFKLPFRGEPATITKPASPST